MADEVPKSFDNEVSEDSGQIGNEAEGSGTDG